jgi:TPR repeat protein
MYRVAVFPIQKSTISMSETGSKFESHNEPDPVRLAAAYGLFRSDPKSAIEKLKQLAEDGSISSMLHVGQAYRRGNGVEQDFAEAERWFCRAANLGSRSAYYLLGRLCLTQHRDKDAAMAFEHAATMRYVPAIHFLGRLYLEGRGVPRDPEKGEALLRRAASGGSILAKGKLGHVLIKSHRGTKTTLLGAGLLVKAFLELVKEAFARGNTSERLK